MDHVWRRLLPRVPDELQGRAEQLLPVQIGIATVSSTPKPAPSRIMGCPPAAAAWAKAVARANLPRAVGTVSRDAAVSGREAIEAEGLVLDGQDVDATEAGFLCLAPERLTMHHSARPNAGMVSQPVC